MFLSAIHNFMPKPFLLLKEQRDAWCTELVNVDIFLFVFRVNKEVDILSIYANLSSFSLSRMHKPSTIILYGEFCPTPYRVWGEHREEWTIRWTSAQHSEPETEPVFERTRCPFAHLCLMPLTSHWISLYFSFQSAGKKITVFSTFPSALRLLDEKHRWGYLQ